MNDVHNDTILKKDNNSNRSTDILEPKSDATSKQTIIVQKSGLLRPIGIAIALVIVGWFSAWGWIQYERSATRLALHTKPVHEDKSQVQVKIKRVFVDRPVEKIVEKKVEIEKVIYREPDPKQLKPGETSLIISGLGGQRMRVAISDATMLTSFQQEMKLFVEGERHRIKSMVQTEIKRVFADAFTDKEESLKRYSEWFFAWSRSWILLKESLVTAVSELPKSVSREKIGEAVRHTLTEYLMRHYEQFVLKPEIRNGPIERGLNAVFTRAHERYRSMLKQLDLKRQVFIAQHSRHMENLSGNAVQIKLDWDSQKWKAPRYALENKAMEILRTAGFATGGALLGRTIWRPLVRRIMTGLGLRVAAANSTAIEGTIAGTLVEPGMGSFIGFAGGLMVDYAWSKIDEKLSEGDFISDNRKAVDETIAGWEDTTLKAFLKGIDIWMDDTVAVVETTIPQG